MSSETKDNTAENASPIVLGNRTKVVDHYVKEDIVNQKQDFRYHDFVKLNAMERRFKNVNFEHCTFDSCYFKKCTFDSCTFTGCRFISCNLHQSSFVGCDFRYATFDKTHLDTDILEREAPLEENLRMHFARNLRMNFQQVGDAKAVNKAISLELETTKVYLLKSWFSNETYYRKKYAGFKKAAQFFRWLEFIALDFIWGNGESVLKLLRSLLLIILAICFYDTIGFNDPYNIKHYLNSVGQSASVFFGYNIPTNYPDYITAIISASRLTFFALFTAILVKRFSRR